MIFIAAFSSPLIWASTKAGMQTRSMPLGATYHLAIAIALIA